MSSRSCLPKPDDELLGQYFGVVQDVLDVHSSQMCNFQTLDKLPRGSRPCGTQQVPDSAWHTGKGGARWGKRGNAYAETTRTSGPLSIALKQVADEEWIVGRRMLSMRR